MRLSDLKPGDRFRFTERADENPFVYTLLDGSWISEKKHVYMCDFVVCGLDDDVLVEKIEGDE